MEPALPPGRDNLAEEQLIKAWQAGDLGAFEVVFARHQGMIYNLAFRILGNLDDAQDIKQETFLRAHRAIRTFRGDCQLSTWLCRIATNLCLSLRRRAEEHTVSLEERFEEAAIQPDLEALMDQRTLQANVQRALDQLPEHHRLLLVLRDFEGLSYEEIAIIMGCSVAGVNTRLHRARLAFKRIAQPLLQTEEIYTP